MAKELLYFATGLFSLFFLSMKAVLTQATVNPTCIQCSCFFQTLPTNITILETDPSDTVLQSVSVSFSSTLLSTISLNVEEPTSLASYLNDFIHFQYTNSTFYLVLTQSIDVENIYEEKNVALTYFLLKISCDQNYSVISMNVTDVDDNGPQFANTDDTNCSIPGYTASSKQNYVGKLTTSPGDISASDGDLIIANNVTYSILYGEPLGYDAFFTINTEDGYINKTKEITDEDPQNFIILIQAKEISNLSRTKVAVLDIGVIKDTVAADTIVTANGTVLLLLRILSGLLILMFTLSFAVIIHHRMKNEIMSPKSSIKKFENVEMVTEDSFILENTIVLTENNQMNGSK